MSGSNVHVLHRPAPLPAGFLRVGHTGQNKLEALLVADRLPYRRFVFDAAYLPSQGDLRQAAARAGCEIVLDLNAAETAAPGRFSSAVAKLPWGNLDRPWTPADFGAGRNDDLCRRMAEFVVHSGAHAVLAPTHISDSSHGAGAWHDVDRRAIERLRQELDRAGAVNVAIDHVIIIAAEALRDAATCQAAIDAAADLPVQNVWLRIGGFGATATGVRTRHLIEAMRRLHALGRPLVVDMAGGFPALSALAFGAVGGMSHGVGQRESFDLAAWRKPPPECKGGGLQTRLYIAELDRYLDATQANAFFAARGIKSRFACTDASCCRTGGDDMLENPHAHFLTQRHRQIEALGRVPEDRRAEHFLLHSMDLALRSTRQAAKLKFADETVQKAVADAKARLGRLRDALGALHQADAGAVTRSRAPAFRGGKSLSGQALAAAVMGAVS